MEDMKQAAIEQIRSTTDEMLRKRGQPLHVFSLKRERCALIVVDMQNFVCISDNPLPGLEMVIEKINKLARFCRQKEIPVIWIRQNFSLNGEKNDGGLYDVLHGNKMDPGKCNFGPATEIYEKMDFDGSTDIVVTKNRYSAFIRGASQLEERLAALGKDQLITVGVVTNACVEATIRDGMMLGYEMTLACDATTAYDEIAKESALSSIRLFFGDVKESAEIIGELE